MPTLAISFSDWNVHDPDPEPGRRADFIMRGCHIVTPSITARGLLNMSAVAGTPVAHYG